jgi:hypothetical protein
MERLPAQTLRGLLQMYDAAIADLSALSDPGVAALIRRLNVHRDEVIAALPHPTGEDKRPRLLALQMAHESAINRPRVKLVRLAPRNERTRR